MPSESKVGVHGTKGDDLKAEEKPKYMSRLVRRCACGRARGYMRKFDYVADLASEASPEGRSRRDEVKLVGGSDERF